MKCRYALFRHSECRIYYRYTECCYVECLRAECRGAIFEPNLDDCASVCATAEAAISSSEIRKTQLNRLS
jgi:hypothetical protein